MAGSGKDLTDEIKIRRLTSMLEGQGIKVRREKLSRGSAFRVKSGRCELSGDSLLFVDRRLPVDQQLSVLEDFISGAGLAGLTNGLVKMPPAVDGVSAAHNEAHGAVSDR